MSDIIEGCYLDYKEGASYTDMKHLNSPETYVELNKTNCPKLHNKKLLVISSAFELYKRYHYSCELLGELFVYSNEIEAEDFDFDYAISEFELVDDDSEEEEE